MCTVAAKPARGTNAFMVFSKEHRAAVKATKPDAKVTEIAIELGARWRALSGESQQHAACSVQQSAKNAVVGAVLTAESVLASDPKLLPSRAPPRPSLLLSVQLPRRPPTRRRPPLPPPRLKGIGVTPAILCPVRRPRTAKPSRLPVVPVSNSAASRPLPIAL